MKIETLVPRIFLSILGGAVGILFSHHIILNMPSSVAGNMVIQFQELLSNTPFSPSSRRAILQIVAAWVTAMPRIIVSGIMLGVLASRIRFPRTLLYSVFAWPLAILFLKFLHLSLVGYGLLKGHASAAMTRSMEMQLTQAFMFYFAASALFAIAAFCAYQLSVRISQRRATASGG